MDEVFIAGRTGRRHDCYALRDQWERERLVAFEQSFAAEPVDHLLALPGHVAQRVGRIDIDDCQREAVDRVECHGDAQHDTHADSQRLAGFGFEPWQGGAADIRPRDRSRLRHHSLARLLHQIDVAVAARHRLHLGDFGGNPERVRQPLREEVADQPQQLFKRHRLG